MSEITLHPGDNVLSMRAMPANSVHSVVTDPPYMLTSIVKRFGSEGAAAARTEKNDGSFARLSGGFMNKKWDSPTVEIPPLSPEFGHYMAGLVDGEGCFHVHKKTVNNCETYDCQFSITLRADDRDILVEMQKQLGGIGTLATRDRSEANAQVRYCISSKAHCQILRAALTVFPLRAKKARDFEIWAHALDAWVNHEPKSSWEDVSFYRDQLMLVKRFGSFYKPELLFHYRWLRECYRVMKPGAYIFAFSGSRTGHWQACAMEMAGFIMHPMHGWVFGSGFPKAHAADKAIDKQLGAKGGKGAVRGSSGSDRNCMSGDFTGGEYHEYVPGSDEAAQWEGWAYGTQTQKPALEPIYLGQKPFDCKTGAANLLKHGVGAVNIDGCRVPGEAWKSHNATGLASVKFFSEGEAKEIEKHPHEAGRHPANLILDGSTEVVAMFPNGKSGKPGTRSKIAESHSMSGDLGLNGRVEVGYADEGSAARFFHHFPPDADPLFYHPKAGKADRAGSKHPTVKPIALMQYLVRHITPPGGVVLDPFAGSGTTAEAARREGFDCILMEAEPEYLDFLNDRFDIEQPAPAFDFDDILGEAMPTSSTSCGADHIFGDLL